MRNSRRQSTEDPTPPSLPLPTADIVVFAFAVSRRCQLLTLIGSRWDSYGTDDRWGGGVNKTWRGCRGNSLLVLLTRRNSVQFSPTWDILVQTLFAQTALRSPIHVLIVRNPITNVIISRSIDSFVPTCFLHLLPAVILLSILYCLIFIAKP